MIKIHLSPVSQIKFPTKGTNTARWFQVKGREIVQVKSSNLACYLIKERKQTLNSCVNFVQHFSTLISL